MARLLLGLGLGILFSMCIHGPIETAGSSVQKRLSSKTPYKFARRVPSSQGATDGLPSRSKVLYLFYIGRHGTRYPTASVNMSLENLETVLQARSSGGNFSWMEDWKCLFCGHLGQLHRKGEIELQNLGKRYAARFPDLFQQPYSTELHHFASTQVPRVSASAIAFAQGLFPCAHDTKKGGSSDCRPQPVTLNMRPKEHDPLLRPYRMCPAYEQYMAEVDPVLEKWETHCRKPLVEKVEQVLSLKPGSATDKTVSALWELCQNEAALLGTTDQFCSIFTDEDINLLEYCDDVKHFTTNGHSNCKAYNMATALGADLIKHLTEAVEAHSAQGPNRTSSANPPGPELARFYFAHDHTLAGIAAWLGLFGSQGPCGLNTTDFRAANPLATLLPPPPADREWWGSTVTPFAVNMAVFLYQAPGSEDVVARLLWNERAVPIPWCGNDIDCDALEFVDALESQGLFSIEEACSVEANLAS